MEPTEGALIADRYVLERSIGEGGMGAVWAGRQVLTRKAVALKFVRESASGRPEVRRRLLREARAACAVQHPNVVQIHDFIELDDGAPVIVMELLTGEPLERLLEREGRLTLQETAAILARVVSAVGAAHEIGIVHRDLKPDNVFLAETPTGIEVKVLDFGIAKLTATEGVAAETGGLTGTGAMLGTPHYMSPEQAFGQSDVDHRADIWAIGIILFRCLSGELPTRADNIGQILRIIVTRSIPSLRDVAPDTPDDVIDLVDRMLKTERDERPSDLREVYEVLVRHAGLTAIPFGPAAKVESGRGATSPAASSRREVPAKSGRALTGESSRWRGWAAFGALLAVALGGLASWGLGDARDAPEPESSASAEAAEPPAATSPAAQAPPPAPPATVAGVGAELDEPPAKEPTPSVAPAPAPVTSSFAATQPKPKPPAQPASSTDAVVTATPAPEVKPPELGGVIPDPPF